MQYSFKKSLLVILCLACMLSLLACSGGIKGEDAKATINAFFDAIAQEDYTAAEALLHPDRPADLEAYLTTVEADSGIDFQAGIVIEDYTGVSISYYDSTVDGSTYELRMQTMVGTEEVDITIEVVKNDAGYGIYNLTIDP